MLINLIRKLCQAEDAAVVDEDEEDEQPYPKNNKAPFLIFISAQSSPATRYRQVPDLRKQCKMKRVPFYIPITHKQGHSSSFSFSARPEGEEQ